MKRCQSILIVVQSRALYTALESSPWMGRDSLKSWCMALLKGTLSLLLTAFCINFRDSSSLKNDMGSKIEIQDS